jgi:hypothetical protein
MSEQQRIQRDQQHPAERCPACGWTCERIVIHQRGVSVTDGQAESLTRTIEKLVPLPIDAATLAVADASLAVLAAEEKHTEVWEQSPAAMVHHGDRWISEAKAARLELETAGARLKEASLALRVARAKEGP